MTNAILITKDDNVATVVSDIKRDAIISIKTDSRNREVKAKEDIPYGHKVALIRLAKDSGIIKYGHIIGYAVKDIEQGEWVHVHNTSDVDAPSI